MLYGVYGPGLVDAPSSGDEAPPRVCRPRSLLRLMMCTPSISPPSRGTEPRCPKSLVRLRSEVAQSTASPDASSLEGREKRSSSGEKQMRQRRSYHVCGQMEAR
jgi:hypothetical protein